MSERRSTFRAALHLGLVAALIGLMGSAQADTSLPFEGTWVRADRACLPMAPSARTYTARALISPGGHCTIRKVAFGAGEYEIFEDCHRVERGGNVVEKIRMAGPDAFVLKFQLNRLKIPRGRRFLRCSIAAPKPLVPGPGRPPISAAPKPGSSSSPSLHDMD